MYPILDDPGATPIEELLKQVRGQKIPEPTVSISRFSVSCLPAGHDLAPHFRLSVSERDTGKWAVTNLAGQCMSADGRWDDELCPSRRPDGWDTTHRFDLATALRLAKQAARGLTKDGLTVADALSRGARRARG